MYDDDDLDPSEYPDDDDLDDVYEEDDDDDGADRTCPACQIGRASCRERV